MSLIFVDGFEGYNAAAGLVAASGTTRWASFYEDGWGGSVTINSSTYRTTQVTAGNSRSLYITAGQVGGAFAILTLPGLQEFFLGFGVRLTNLPADRTLLSFYQTSSASQGIAINVSASGQLQVYIPNGSTRPGTILATGAQSLSLHVWYYLEVRVLRGGAGVGVIEVRVNGATEINITTNTTTGITQFNNVIFCPGGNYSYAAYFDDLYICTPSGAVNNTFLGPTSVYSLLPDGAGSSTQFTPNGAATNWQCLTEATADTTTYVQTSDVGNKDFYTIQDLPSGISSIYGVMVKTRNNAVGVASAVIQSLKNGTDTLSSSSTAVTAGSWVMSGSVFETAPNGGAWTKTALDDSEAGIELG